jgi:hypothetical protein
MGVFDQAMFNDDVGGGIQGDTPLEVAAAMMMMAITNMDIIQRWDYDEDEEESEEEEEEEEDDDDNDDDEDEDEVNYRPDPQSRD